jgi:hypothetical protein
VTSSHRHHIFMKGNRESMQRVGPAHFLFFPLHTILLPPSYSSSTLCRLKPSLPLPLHEMFDHLLLSGEWSMTHSHCWYCINHYCTSELPKALKSCPLLQRIQDQWIVTIRRAQIVCPIPSLCGRPLVETCCML